MKVLHTSDWHLGRSLYGRKRYEEFSAFLDWLVQTITNDKIDLLLVAGDIFDTSTPSNQAQRLYYHFLCRIAASPCRHVVIIGGNHDSPSFLEAPKALLQTLNVYVVGAISESVNDEVIVLHTHEGTPEAIICAVPYLRDKDIRSVEAGESIEEKNAKLLAGIKAHYAAVCLEAEKIRSEMSNQCGLDLPIIGTGHLFTRGGITTEDDGVRELYVGSLAHTDVNIFPACLDYVALGHLHVAQVVEGIEHIRYSGSPLPMGFGEANQQKLLLIIQFTGREPQITSLNIPRFQALHRVSGNLEQIGLQIEQLKEQKIDAWLEIDFTGEEIVASLRQSLEEALKNSMLEIRRIKNGRIINKLIHPTEKQESLDELSIDDVFQHCLDSNQVAVEQRKELQASYREITQQVLEQDTNAE